MTRVVETGPAPVSLRPATWPALPARYAIAEMQNVSASGRIWYARTDDPPEPPKPVGQQRPRPGPSAAFLAAVAAGPAHFLDPGQRAFRLQGGSIFAWSADPERLAVTDAGL